MCEQRLVMLRSESVKRYMPIKSNTWSVFLEENLPKRLEQALRAKGYPTASICSFKETLSNICCWSIPNRHKVPVRDNIQIRKIQAMETPSHLGQIVFAVAWILNT